MHSQDDNRPSLFFYMLAVAYHFRGLIALAIIVAWLCSGCATRYAPDDTSIFGNRTFLNQVRH